MFSEKILKWYDKHGQPRPNHFPHGKEDDVREKMQRLEVKKWKQEGNKLIGETASGQVVNLLPTDVMLVGTDDDNRPILEKIELL